MSGRTPASSPIPQIVLASSSPRRSALLDQVGVPFRTIHPDVDEESIEHPDPVQSALRRAQAKLDASLRLCDANDRFVLSADTMVFVGDRVYGKPVDATDAGRMLRELAGRTHTVVTACAWAAPRCTTADATNNGRFYDTSDVKFLPLSPTEIAEYLRNDEWQGVAGGYRIQGHAARFIESIAGSYATVMGLPIHRVYSILRAYFETIQSH